MRRSLRMLAVTFHQNDNIRESAIQLPLVVDILQGEGRCGGAPRPCIFVCFFGVRIVLVLVSGQIELDDGLQNTIFHVGRRVAQVKAAGDPPVCFAVAGCLALDGDKVCGNVESRKIIFCNCGCGHPVNLQGARHPQPFRHCWSTIRRLSFTAVIDIGHSRGVLGDCQNIAGNCAIRPSAGFGHIKTGRQRGEIKGFVCSGNFDGVREVIKLYLYGGAAIP